MCYIYHSLYLNLTKVEHELNSSKRNVKPFGYVGIGTASPGNYKLNVAGTVNASAYVTNGTDYAEFVPKFNPTENITAGDVVGIREGKAAKNTTVATTIMVVSGDSMGIIAGGNPMENSGKFRNDWTNPNTVPVAFVGQVKVKVENNKMRDCRQGMKCNDCYAPDFSGEPDFRRTRDVFMARDGTWKRRFIMGF